MSRGFLFTILCLASVFSSVLGSVTLVPRLSTATCSGHFQDISVTSITCGYSNSGCTYGSEVFVTGQVTTDSDLPRPLDIHVSRTFPSHYNIGTNVYNNQVVDICDSGTVTAYPDSDDAAYSCPSAGVYNFNFVFENFGGRQKWYAGWSGFSMGMAIHFKHEGGGQDWATCTLNVRAEGGEDDSYATNAAFVSVATLGLAGLCVGLFVRRRKERLANNDENNNDERTKELATNFELVQDSASNVV